MPHHKKSLGIFSLIMMNVIAVDSIRTLPISALYGLPLVFYYLACAIGFMIPIALIAAECSTGWPEEGGIYLWVKLAFGPSCALFVAWTQWIYNIIWFPSITALLAITIFYIIQPDLVHNKILLLLVINSLFWFTTYINCHGIKVSGWICSVCTIIGTLLPISLFIVLTIAWIMIGHPPAIELNLHHIFPHTFNIHNAGLLTGMVFGLIGLELSAVHASDVTNPQKDYPKALWVSAVIILTSLILGSLAISIVIPADQLNLASGIIESFALYFKAFHVSWLTPIIAICIVIGGLGGLSTWLLGPSRCMQIASRDHNAPAFFAKKNKHHAPINILMTQGIIFSLFSCCYLLFPGFNTAYWLLTAITAQLALMVYMMVFLAAIQLRIRYPHQARPFKIPGGKIGIILIGSLGFITCLIIFSLGFIPPDMLNIHPVGLYETLLISSIVLFSTIPFFIKKFWHKI